LRWLEGWRKTAYLSAMANNLSGEGRSLEDEFFRKENDRLMESLREMKALEETTGLLSEVSGITDPKLLERLAQLKVTPAAVTALAILPLIEVAWADGMVEPAERQAIIESLEAGMFFQTVDRAIVEQWLTQAPPPELFATWETYAQHVMDQLAPDEKKALSEGILGHARKVAKAAGTVLGFGGISKAEQAVLDRLAKTLT